MIKKKELDGIQRIEKFLKRVPLKPDHIWFLSHGNQPNPRPIAVFTSGDDLLKFIKENHGRSWQWGSSVQMLRINPAP